MVGGCSRDRWGGVEKRLRACDRMERIPEPELMDDPAQAEAYHRADFGEPHAHFIALFRHHFPAGSWQGPVLDLGCGTADITRRFALTFRGVEIHGIDGAEAMLRWGRESVAAEGLDSRVRLSCRRLPTHELPGSDYGAVISNSLLHHLADPLVLWSAIRFSARVGAPVFVMDLLRPATPAHAAELVASHAVGESDLLRRDFFNFLCAGYRPDEVERQLLQGGLDHLTLEVISDRHWLVYGRA